MDRKVSSPWTRQHTLVWPAAGSYTLAATAERDKHGRQYNPPKIIQLAVNVQ